jgi:hypothetical protein
MAGDVKLECGPRSRIPFRNLELNLVGTDRLAAQRTHISPAVTAPNALRLHARQAATGKTGTGGMLQALIRGGHEPLLKRISLLETSWWAGTADWFQLKREQL